jgi:hypothetical protein
MAPARSNNHLLRIKSSLHATPKRTLIGNRLARLTSKRQPNGTVQLRANWKIALENQVKEMLEVLDIQKPSIPKHCNQACIVNIVYGKTTEELTHVGRWFAKVRTR